MTQSPEEWTIAAIAKRKPGIEIGPLRPAALQPYQEAYFRELLAGEHEVVTVMVPMNGGYTYQRGVDAYMAKLTVDRLKEMAEQIDTAAAELNIQGGHAMTNEFIRHDPLSRHPENERPRIRQLYLRANQIALDIEEHNIDLDVLSERTGIRTVAIEMISRGHIHEVRESVIRAIEDAVAGIVGGGA